MKTLAFLPVTGLLAGPLSFGADEVTPHPTTPKEGFVPNEQTAIQIAVAVWRPIYGKDTIERRRPYKARLKNDIWHVSEQLPRQKVEGVAIDAKIVRVSPGR